MEYFIIIYNSFIWGMLFSILAFQNKWLEMRINMGIIIPVVMILSLGIFTILRIKISKRWTYIINKGTLFSTVNTVVSVIIMILVLGIERIKIVPAAIIREGLNITRVHFSTINIFILATVIISLFMIVFSGIKRNR